jgi:VanZ family protein
VLKKHLYTTLFISWVVLITLLSLFSFPDIDDGTGIVIPHIDKITHFTFHLIFVVLGCLFLKEKIGEAFKPNKGILIILIAAILYGILIEVLQYVMPFGRAAEIWDILANTMGALFGGLLIKKYFSLTRKLK